MIELNKPECLGVLLDIDGTLVDSNLQHAMAWQEAFAINGFTVSLGYVRGLVGMGGDKIIPNVTTFSAESEIGKKIITDRSRIFEEKYLSQIQAFPHSHSLIDRFIEEGLKIAVISSADLKELKRILQQCDLMYLFPFAVSSAFSKPDPDIIYMALNRLDLSNTEALVLGDTPYDLEAARRANVGFVGLRCGGWSDLDFAGAVSVYQDPADLEANFKLSPFYSGKAIQYADDTTYKSKSVSQSDAISLI